MQYHTTRATRKACEPMMNSDADSSCLNYCCVHDGLRLVELQEGTLDRRQQLELALDCARGVDFLHNGNDEHPRLNGPIVHNDLKSFNVLVRASDRTEKPFVAKLADLEFAQDNGTSGRGDGSAQFVRTESAMMRPPPVPDTVNWTAPELMRVGEEAWPTVESDAWALGMLCFEIFALEIPFSEGQCTIDRPQCAWHFYSGYKAVA